MFYRLLFNRLIDQLIELVKKLPFQGRFTDWIIQLLAAMTSVSGDGGDIVFHYGCPNSKRTKKLQLKKRIIK